MNDTERKKSAKGYTDPTSVVDPDDTAAMLRIVQAENETLKREVERLADQLNFITDLHHKAVDRVNKVTFAKLKLENQLELLQSMIGTALARFQVDTEV